jgi:hypothetical protein
MKSIIRILAICALIFALNPVIAANAGREIWLDATHYFEEDVKKLVKNLQLESRNDYSKRVKAPAPEVKDYKVGDKETFWTKNIVENKFEQTKAVLRAVGKHCYVFLEEGKHLSAASLEKLRKTFDEKIYPTNTGNFGSEWKPGIDGDNRVFLLMFDIKDGYNGTGGFVGGYFFAGDQYLNSQIPEQYNIKSNEREIMYLDIYPSDPTKDRYMTTVAHEFQHMIHFHQDPGEATWVNEACSQIAPYLCGFGHANQIMSYMKTPDNSLTAWSDAQMLANYGQVYLWTYYLYNRFIAGKESRDNFFKKLAASKEIGLNGYAEALKPFNKSFSETFFKFMIANYINDQRMGKKNEYAYDKTLGRMLLPPAQNVNALPAEVKGEVFFWSADAVKVDLTNAREDVEVKFTAPMFKMSYDLYNEFSVAIVQMNSRGKVAPKLKRLYIRQVKSRKTQGGTAKITPDKDYDTAMIIVAGHVPEEIDEKMYKKAKGITYNLSVKDAGATVARAIASADTEQLFADYAELSVIDAEESEAALMIRLNSLEDIDFNLSRSLKTDIEAGDFENLDKIIEKLADKSVDSNRVQPLLKNIISIIEFQIGQNRSGTELVHRLETLKSLK